MARAPGPLYWIEMALAVASGAAFAMWVAEPRWIESMFEVAPDGGNGWSEWEIAVALLIAAFASSMLAWGEWRRCRAG
jgi:hypothetical protein